MKEIEGGWCERGVKGEIIRGRGEKFGKPSL